MSLQAKVLSLKLNAALAVKHANGWQKLINLYGEERATEFYKHLGLNHLETKGFEYEGLTLSREPKEHEKIAVKGIANAQESAKESIGKILMELRAELITDGLKRIQKLKPATYHELVLKTPAEITTTLREWLISVHHQGRMLVAAELGVSKGALTIHQPDCNERFIKNDPPGYQCQCGIKALIDDEFDELDELTDLTSSRVVNDVQSRLIASMQRFTLGGLTGPSLINAVTNDINGGSVAYIDAAAAGVAHKVIGIGRLDEMHNRADEIDRYEQSALLDAATCDVCLADDGKTASNPDDLPGGPNPECLGSGYCRCFIVAIAA